MYDSFDNTYQVRQLPTRSTVALLRCKSESALVHIELRQRESAEANIWRVPSVQFEAGVCGVCVGDAQGVRMRELAC